MSSKKLLNDSFNVNELKLIDVFNSICEHFRNVSSFQNKFIILYKKFGLNIDIFKEYIIDVKKIYNNKLNEGYDENEIKSYIPDANIQIAIDFVKRHEVFSKRLNSILKINTLYTKYTVKESAIKYIQKILPIFFSEGLEKALTEIVNNDKLSLSILNKDYFDNLAYYAIICATPRLKGCNFSLKEIFATAEIAIAYDVLIRKVHKYSDITKITINDDNCLLANEARYINNIKPDVFLTMLRGDKLSIDKVNEVYEDYKEYYNKRLLLDIEGKNNKFVIEKNENISNYLKIVTMFIDEDISLDDFLKKYNLNNKIFKKAIDTIKNCYPDVYQKYLDKISKLDDVIDLELLLHLLKNGIVVNGKKVRDFDLIDYYRLTTIKPSEAKKIANRCLAYDDYLKVSDFSKVYVHDLDRSNTNITDLTSIGIGNYMSTEEDKKEALLWLNKIGAPVTEYTYKIMLKRYLLYKFKDEKQKKI